MREKLPQRRYSETFELVFNQSPVSVTIGCHQDGGVGEVFLAMQKKAGSQADLAARDIAILLSLAIQHGVPLATINDALTKDAEGRPAGLAGYVVPHLLEGEASAC